SPVTRDLPSGDLVDRLRRFCFHLLRYPNYGALTFTPAGLSPAEHASLTWTHLRTKNCQKTKNDYLTGKAPYRFESFSLQRRVRSEPDPLAAGTPVNTPIGSVPPGYPSPRASAPLRVRLQSVV